MTPKKIASKNPSVLSFLTRHKILNFVGALIIIAGILTAIEYYRVYQEYRKRLTEENYVAIEAMAQDVMREAGGGGAISKNKKCSYERPGIYADLHLFCSLEMVTFIPYKGERHALDVAEGLKQAGAKYGNVFTHSDDFFRRPANNNALFSIDLNNPLPKTQCSFNIFTNQRAKDAATFVHKTEGDLIALHFYCSAQSRGEYFPVTYRQG